MSTPISRFPVVELTTLPDDLREYVETVAEKTGFVPNVFLALAHRPDELRAFIGMHDALMLKDSPALSKADREMIVVATSAANDCLYCVVAHGAVLRIRRRDPLIADQVATNYRKADLTTRERAMLDFAVKVATDSAAVSTDDFDVLRAEGFTDDDMWDIGSIAALFAYSNRMANFASMMPNEEFYSMSRSG
jgi:uncharacterized peroxidase-related enzyme